MCTISLNQPTVVSSGGTISSITISGSIGPQTTCACDVVDVKISCLHGTISTTQPAFITWSGGTGTFSVTFTGNDITNCVCEKEILVIAQCDTVTETVAFTIDCESDKCDDLDVISLPGNLCVNQAFQFQVAYTGGGTVNMTVNFNDGTVVNLPAVGAAPVNVAHTYITPGNYQVIISFNGIRCTYNISVKECDCCADATAVITSDVEVKCNDDLTKTVQVDAVITPTPKPNCPTTVSAEMYIDNNLVATGSGSSPFTLTHTDDYDCGDHTVTIKYPDFDCPDSGGTFCVSVCETFECIKRRYYFALAATVGIIALILFIFNSVYTFLGVIALVALIIAIVLYFKWRPCDLRCKKCPRILACWQIGLASYLGFLMLSKSTFIIIYTWLVGVLAFLGPFAPVVAILIIVLIMLLIAFLIWLVYQNWVGTCCPTECEKCLALLWTIVLICAPAVGILVFFLSLTWIGGGAAVLALFTIPGYVTILAIIAFWIGLKVIKACKIFG